ncbi:MAG: hypothetical protein V1777_01200 [Candidatus Micrarchaeota archaeon]
MSPKPFKIPPPARTPFGRFFQERRIQKIKAKRLAPPFSLKRFENRMRFVAEQLQTIHDTQLGEQQNWSEWMQRFNILKKKSGFELNLRDILQTTVEMEETARETDKELSGIGKKIRIINKWLKANNPPENQKRQLPQRVFQAIQILRELQKRQAEWKKTLATNAAKFAAKGN